MVVRTDAGSRERLTAGPRGWGWPRRVRSFQRKHELPETGVVDQGTAEALARVDQTVPIVHEARTMTR